MTAHDVRCDCPPCAAAWPPASTADRATQFAAGWSEPGRFFVYRVRDGVESFTGPITGRGQADREALAWRESQFDAGPYETVDVLPADPATWARVRAIYHPNGGRRTVAR